MLSAAATLRAQRWVVVALFVGSAVLVWPRGYEPFMLARGTLIVLCGLALVGLAMARWSWERRAAVPVSPAVVAAGLFVVGLVAATVFSTDRWLSLIGVQGRYHSLAPYLAYVILFLAVLRLADLPFLRLLRRTGVVLLALAVAYGFLQAAGVDPAGLPDIGLGRTYSFFGQVNFSAAWAAAVAALALVTALDPEESRGWRTAAAGLVPLDVVYLLLTETAQGVAVFAAVLLWVAVVLGAAPDSPVRAAFTRHRRPALAVAATGALLLATAVVVALPTLRDQLAQSLVERPDFWSAALRIFQDHPVVGTGLDTFVQQFLMYRPVEHALALGFGTADNPHSVPLSMLSNGGLLLALPYAAFVLLTGWALVRGAFAVTGPRRTALAAFGGVWVGYQVQSLVSFDVPPLAVLHWLSAGAVLSLAAAPSWRAVVLPGAPAVVPTDPRGRPVGDVEVPGSTWALAGVAGLLLLVVAWSSTGPFRADSLAAADTNVQGPREAQLAVERFRRAAELNPAEPSFPYMEAQTWEAVGRPEQALEAGIVAAERAPGSVQYALFVAKQAQVLGRDDVAATWIREAVRRDPKNPAVLVQAGGYLKSKGAVEEADGLLRRALELDGANQEAQRLLSGGAG